MGGLWGDRRPSRCLTPSLGLLLGSMPPAALEPGELSSILIVEYDNDVYDNDDSDDNDNGDDNDAKLHSPLRWLTFAVRLKELTRGILDAISIRRRQGCSHEPSQREPILVELGKGSCISRSSFSFSSEAGGTFGCREPAAAAASALGPAEGMAAFGAGADGDRPRNPSKVRSFWRVAHQPAQVRSLALCSWSPPHAFQG